MRFAKRRWKQAAEAALAPVSLEAERQAVAEEIAARLVGRARGVPGGYPGLVRRIADLIDDASVRVALASRYVAELQERVAQADYDEAAALGQELAWVRTYLEERLLCPLLVGPEAEQAGRGADRESGVLEPLYDTLLQAMGGQLVLNDEAAA